MTWIRTGAGVIYPAGVEPRREARALRDDRAFRERCRDAGPVPRIMIATVLNVIGA